ncbi:hypothetical protein Goklo_015420 [Gossypium klotzschianum]|uniref:Uncharacterized protein n=1 Tax=Gossypium klotzschianum TaxID=34286 RepID=A0A7J8UBC9_9ROSI|nr:hypothetical protein [Gossypium klotzschianum]
MGNQVYSKRKKSSCGSINHYDIGEELSYVSARRVPKGASSCC